MAEETTSEVRNPLLDPMPRLPQWLVDQALLAKELKYSPFTAESKLLPAIERHLLTESFQQIFVPTVTAMTVVKRLYWCVYKGLIARNPLHAKVQRWTNATTQYLGQKIEQVPWFPTFAMGMVIEGLTGIGKSHIVSRALSLLPQVIDHEPHGEWGMVRLKQLVWLKVEMPADSTRKGLLLNILREIDRVLETDYYARQENKSIEVLLVTVMFHLAQHRCGLLVIEDRRTQFAPCLLSRDLIPTGFDERRPTETNGTRRLLPVLVRRSASRV